MLINILSTKNGVGLQKDAELLIAMLTAAGHKCFFVDIGKGGSPKHADINIFCELFHRVNFTRMAKKNYLFPNPEWFEPTWLTRSMPSLTGILCKTHDAFNIFSEHSDKCVYTGFTSRDMLLPEIPKQNAFFHAAGKSNLKGTKEIIATWVKYPELPEITVTHQMNLAISVPANVNYKYQNYSDEQFRKLLNSYQFHFCPSHYEGWGHYIHEAKSTGAIVITTNGAPMNEFVNSKYGYLCPVSSTKKQNMADLAIVSIGGIYESAAKCIKMPQDKIIEMSANARASYLEGEKSFKETFLNIIG